MNNQTQQITDRGNEGKYGVYVPRMVIEDLDPHQKALWLHYKTVCANSPHGVCFEKVATTAKGAKMATGMVVKTRNELHSMGFIAVEEHPIFKTLAVTMIDIWPENARRYGSRSPHEPIVVIPDLSVLDLEQQQQLSFIVVHDMNMPSQLQYLIDHCALLETISENALKHWIVMYGEARVCQCARWYCYARDFGKARTGGWLTDALRKAWPMPDGFQDHMYLSEADNAARYTSDWGSIDS